MSRATVHCGLATALAINSFGFFAGCSSGTAKRIDAGAQDASGGGRDGNIDAGAGGNDGGVGRLDAPDARASVDAPAADSVDVRGLGDAGPIDSPQTGFDASARKDGGTEAGIFYTLPPGMAAATSTSGAHRIAG
jgi:hypothetical protein